MKRKDTYYLVLTSVFASIILLLSLVPQIGFITFLPGVSVTLVHIPTLIGILFLPLKYAWTLGLFFGIGSWLASLIYAVTPFDLAFQNPIIPIVPRILFVIVAYFVFKGLKYLFKNFKFGKIMIVTLVSIISVFSLYFGSLAIVKNAAFAKHASSVTEYNALKAKFDDPENDENITQEQLDELLVQIDTNYDKAVIKEKDIQKIVIPIVLTLSVVAIGAYIFYIRKGKSEEVVVPSTFIISTLAHTILVLATVIIFAPSLFTGTFGEAVNFIYGIALSNGLIEALVAVFIGTPVYLAIRNLDKNEQ